MDEMPKLTLADWAKLPDAVAFGHYESTDFAPYDQTQHLFSEMNVAKEGLVNIYVVFDEVESRTLSAELARFPDPRAIEPVVLNYGTFLRHLRTPGGCEWWKKDYITIIAQMDQHYSAEFVLGFLELVKWVANPTSGARLRVLMLSTFEEPDDSIKQAFMCFCPKYTVSLVYTPNRFQPRRAEPVLQICEKGDFVTTAAQLIKYQVSRRKTSILLCHSEETDLIFSLLETWKVPIRQIRNTDPFVNSMLDIMKKQDDPKSPPVVFVLTELSRVSMEIFRLGAIAISARRAADLWEDGRIVNKPEQTSQWEVEQTISYIWQTSSPTEQVTILTPNSHCLRKLPRRRVDNDQSLSFLVDVFANFKGMVLQHLLQCFVTDFPRVQFNLQQLRVSNCIRMCDDPHCPFIMEPGHRSDLLLSLLPEFKYQFLQPLFLATGLTSQNVTTAAKKAMIRIAAIMHEGIDVITQQSIFWQDVSAAKLMEYLNVFLYKVSMQFSMPPELFMQGGIWVPLAAWHSASITMKRFERNSNATQDTDHIKDVVNGTGIIFMQTILAERVADMVDKLEVFAGLSAIDREYKPLALRETDCTVIQDAMVRAWMHRTISIVIRPGNVWGVSDMVAMDASVIEPSGWDFLPIEAMMGTRGTTDDVMFIAALVLKRNLDPTLGLHFEACVVLPMERIRSWQDEDEKRDFLKDIQCHHPFIEEPQA